MKYFRSLYIVQGFSPALNWQFRFSCKCVDLLKLADFLPKLVDLPTKLAGFPFQIGIFLPNIGGFCLLKIGGLGRLHKLALEGTLTGLLESF